MRLTRTRQQASCLSQARPLKRDAGAGLLRRMGLAPDFCIVPVCVAPVGGSWLVAVVKRKSPTRVLAASQAPLDA